ncbi:hypothetical protein AAF712_010619 [Marasmius tenuissimus]|uniref:Lysine-specific metallo-endopeptidase domain-containing protein n=1 Tax=Marasmius tenuissimus TaxID=585030 RepID=A0ABR2ZLM8_9AGAR
MFSTSTRVAVAALVLSALSASAEPSLSLELAAPTDVDGVHNLKVSATLHNTGDEDLKLLKDPNGLLSKSATDKFKISNVAGSGPSFTGIKVKYSPSHAAKHGDSTKAFTVLKAGDSVEVEHSLAASYDFNQCGEGSYDIDGSKEFHYVDDSTGEVKKIVAKVESGVKAKISGKLAVARSLPVRRAPVNGTASHADAPANITGLHAGFDNCTPDEQALIHTATLFAQRYSFHSYEYLVQNNHSGAARYETWFGKYDVNRHQNVTKHFARVLENPFNNYTYDCMPTECGEGGSTFAYVYPTEFGKIYLCDAFWKANTTGADSKAGTLIHESTHFTIIAGTNDEIYGRNDSEALAQTEPARSHLNVDSHEYFAEDSDPTTLGQTKA